MSGKTSSALVYAFILVGGRGQEKRGWMDSLKSLRRRDLKSFFFEGFFFQRQRCDSYLKRRRSPRIIHIYVQISLHDDRFVHQYKKLHWFLTLASSIPYPIFHKREKEQNRINHFRIYIDSLFFLFSFIPAIELHLTTRLILHTPLSPSSIFLSTSSSCVWAAAASGKVKRKAWPASYGTIKESYTLF